MFDSLAQKFQRLFSSFFVGKTLSEENLSEAIREVRLALLEADVNYSVASGFVKRVKEKAIGSNLIRSLTPTQQFSKILHDELVLLLGKEEADFKLKQKPSTLLLCGLQGSGKTTHAAKIAHFLKKKGKEKVLLAACDLQRPAAVEQLKILSEKAECFFFSIEGEKKPKVVAKKALEKAQAEKFDVLIVDSAGRLHLDEALMRELEELYHILHPEEVLFVLSAAMGQDAAKVALDFHQQIPLTGAIVTMLDGNARAGAILSFQELTGKPIKFEGVGEKISDLQLFHPVSMADRILGMGDMINLARKAEENFNEKEKEKLEKKLRKASFTYEDYLEQMGKIQKMGPLKSLMKMVPGLASMDFDIDFEEQEKEFKKTQAMIFSMTQEEREEKEDLIHSRRLRIAKGCGLKIDEVNRFIKGFKRMKQTIKDMPMGGKKSWL